MDLKGSVKMLVPSRARPIPPWRQTSSGLLFPGVPSPGLPIIHSAGAQASVGQPILLSLIRAKRGTALP